MAGKAISTPFDAITYKIKVIDHLLNRQWLFVPDWLKGEEGKV